KAAGNEVAANCAAALTRLTTEPSHDDAAAALEAICAAGENCPHGRKGEWRDALKEFLEEARFLFSLLGKGGQAGAAPDLGRRSRPLSETLSQTEEFDKVSDKVS